MLMSVDDAVEKEIVKVRVSALPLHVYSRPDQRPPVGPAERKSEHENDSRRQERTLRSLEDNGHAKEKLFDIEGETVTNKICSPS